MTANTRSKRIKEDRRIDSDDFDTIVKTFEQRKPNSNTSFEDMNITSDQKITEDDIDEEINYLEREEERLQKLLRLQSTKRRIEDLNSKIEALSVACEPEPRATSRNIVSSPLARGEDNSPTSISDMAERIHRRHRHK